MTLQRIEVGLVSIDESLAEFYAVTFGMERLPAIEAGPGVVHRLRASGIVIKVMVPKRAPATTEPATRFFAATGLRYITLYSDDLDGIVERATAHGGKVTHGPSAIGPGVRIAVLQDPDGNAVEVVEGAS
ncbi:VOC family protein [Parafrankia discariae]|uniref:VOC family protein n=1 Tax=Parafrankia discariae TaxID=365528 RepID=UPI00035F642B|nr:VOC family protein [Parafrankia discariae]